MSDTHDILSDALAVDHRERATNFCMEMMMAVSSEMHAEGLSGEDSIPEFKARCTEIMSRRRDCPAAATCQKYRQAVQERGRPDVLGIFGERPSVWRQARMIL